MQDAQKEFTVPTDDALIGVRRVADMCDCSISTVYRLVAAGKLPKPYKLGRRSSWKVRELKAAIDKLKDSDHE